MALFRTWMAGQMDSSMHCSIQDLRLNHLNPLLLQVIFDRPSTSMAAVIERSETMSKHSTAFLTDLSSKALILAEELAHESGQKAYAEKTKLYHRRVHCKDVLHYDRTIDAIEKRTNHIIQRIQYNTQQKQRLLSTYGSRCRWH